MAFRQFEEKISPQKEISLLREKVAESPERAKEILKNHAGRKPEEVLAPEHLMSKEEEERIKSEVLTKEREELVDALLEVAKERGVVNAVSIAKQAKIDPSTEDSFHDALIKFLKEGKIKNA
jgi:hypothetical protein